MAVTDFYELCLQYHYEPSFGGGGCVLIPLDSGEPDLEGLLAAWRLSQ